VRYQTIIVLLSAAVVGCMASERNPSIPTTDRPDLDGIHGVMQSSIPDPGPHRLWGEWTFYFNEAHDAVEAVPSREGRFHLNAMKFLEGGCSNCLKLAGIKNNGDGTIDLTVDITHPFPGHPEYTGFDAKGIIMFQGSHEIPAKWDWLPVYPDNFRLSWRLLGDPEVLNAEGYTYYWSPWYDSGSSQPIFNYWKGKYSNGTPTANINAYLYFYSNENRYMFECEETVTRVYHIWLPPGPVAAGYAVDACWMPPDVTPVTDPAADFPRTANQPEAYHFKCVYNDGQPLDGFWIMMSPSLAKARGEIDIRYRYGSYLPPKPGWVGVYSEAVDMCSTPFAVDCAYEKCIPPPDHPTWGCIFGGFAYDTPAPPPGTYQLLAYQFYIPNWGGEKLQFPAFDAPEILKEY